MKKKKKSTCTNAFLKGNRKVNIDIKNVEGKKKNMIIT